MSCSLPGRWSPDDDFGVVASWQRVEIIVDPSLKYAGYLPTQVISYGSPVTGESAVKLSDMPEA